MAHELTIRRSGKAEMAYVGETPWHGLGEQLQRGASIEQWQAAAGMDWEVKRSRVRYEAGDGAENLRIINDQHVLYRGDTREPLGVVSDRYELVQPGQVLGFFRDLVGTAGFELETAGTLFGGRKFWALASIGDKVEVSDGDKVGGYLLLVSSCDGSSATEATETTVRVVCNNTLRMSLSEKGRTSVKVSHRTAWNPDYIKHRLESANGNFSKFVVAARKLSKLKMTNMAAEKFVADLLRDVAKVSTQRVAMDDNPTFQRVLALFNGGGMGAAMAGSKGTAWGMVNAVTEFVDHHAKASTTDHRLEAAWLGKGDDLKTAALERALAL